MNMQMYRVDGADGAECQHAAALRGKLHLEW